MITQSDNTIVKLFKKHAVVQELQQRFQPASNETAVSVPILCSALDPRYSHLKFCSPNQVSYPC